MGVSHNSFAGYLRLVMDVAASEALRDSLGCAPIHRGPTFNVVELLVKKRAGQELSDDEIKILIERFCTGEIPDYQCAAFLMAVCCCGMTAGETAVLTRAMKDSGTTCDLSSVPGPKIDKHSSGGVGDKTSLILAPIVASLGAIVPMMSGRGLGHTGGTLDKLESIPGFRVALSFDEFRGVLKKDGVAIIGTTADIAPADKKMYALRDVTGTVASLPLITGSIMCKKLAENPDSLVLDVKTGLGAFMTQEADAIELAQSMIAAGEGDGKHTTAYITSMDQPLGRAVGNWLEVAESLRILGGHSLDTDLAELSITLAAQMLMQCKFSGPTEGGGSPAKKAKGEYSTLAMAKEKAKAQLTNGQALARFRSMVESQGGDPAVVDLLAKSPHGPEADSLVSGAKELVIYQALFGSGSSEPVPLSDVRSGAASHGCFWTPPCQGLEGCRSLEAFFRRADGSDPPPTSDGSLKEESSVARSVRAPHGPVVARVAGFNALEVGQACIGIGAGREVMGEALSLGAGLLLHKKIGDELREGDVLFTMFVEVDGTRGETGTRRVINGDSVDKACTRIIQAYKFDLGAAEMAKPLSVSPLVRCFVDRDGSIRRPA